MDPRREELRGRLEALGFDVVRFAPLSPGVESKGLTAWLGEGYHADMDWMERTAGKRLDPQQVLPGARSVVIVGVNYLQPARGRGPVWARYSLNSDYHDSMGAALRQAGREIESCCAVTDKDYRYYVDTGPVLERAWAARSGVGFIGKNTMLISRAHGNWLLLGAIFTRVDFEADPPVRKEGDPGRVGALCGSCTRCLDACPTGAFAGPGVLDARRCISYQTIENKGVIPAELRAAIGMRVYGCDHCLEVCPWNRFARDGRSLILASRADLRDLTLVDLLSMTQERFSAVFKGTAIKRLKLRGLLRNACVVAGNSGDAGLLEPVMRLVSHPEAIVRAHAVWAAVRLGGADRLAAARPLESDPIVLAEYP